MLLLLRSTTKSMLSRVAMLFPNKLRSWSKQISYSAQFLPDLIVTEVQRVESEVVESVVL